MENRESDKSNIRESDQIAKWQNKLLPWFIIMPTLLVGVFIFLASQQLVKFNKALETRPDSLLIGDILPNPSDIAVSKDILDNQRYLQWITLTRLEQESFYRRYNQGGLLLMSRIYTKYLGFFTGMILAIVGAVFIIGKISQDSSKGENKSDIQVSASEVMKVNIASSSPGIIFGALGTILMLATIVTHNDVVIQDTPLYLNTRTILSTDLINSHENAGKRDKMMKDIQDKMDTLWASPDE